jgi:hypothetical protein
LLPTLSLKNQVPVLISPNGRVAQLYQQAPRSVLFAFCNTQGCGGGNITCLHTGIWDDYGVIIGKKNLEGSGHGPIEILSQLLPWRTEENNGKPY